MWVKDLEALLAYSLKGKRQSEFFVIVIKAVSQAWWQKLS